MTSYLTLFTFILSLIIFTSIGELSPSLAIVSRIEVPTLPLIKSTASVRDIPWTELLSISIIKSPDCTPALKAGVSSIGVITFTYPPSIVISIPSPPNSPFVPICKSLKSFSFKKVE